jgi:hypothetical protein
MECPVCHKEHSPIAVYCPHCGATLPAPTAAEVAAEAVKSDINAEPTTAQATGRQRTAMKIMVPIVAMLVVASGVVTYVTRMHSFRNVNTLDNKISSPVQTLPGSAVTSAEEDAIYGAALQYATTQGQLSLGRDGLSVTGSAVDVFLKDPANGRRYRVSLVKAGDGGGWVAVSMEETY